MTEAVTGERPDTQDMRVVHAVFRREFGLLPGLVRGVDDGDTERAAVVAGHYRLMDEMLHIHHTGEDELLWPLLNERAPEAAALVARMESQHERLGDLLGTAGARVPPWAVAPGSEGAEQAAAVLDDLVGALDQHLTEEEDQVLPLCARTMTVAEWASLSANSRAKVPQEQAFLVLGMILEDAPPAAAEAMLGEMPPEVRSLWETVGQPQYAAYAAAVRGS